MNPSSLLWYWQSNKNPWEAKEKPEWTPYDEAINLKIEEAYQKKENKINLGEYTIHFAPMIQMHNQDSFKQRKVRREGIKDNVRYFRYCDDLPNPKTINHPYGKSKDFLSFILDKIEEPIKSALQPLEALELKDDKLTFDPIITVVTDAIVLDVYNIPNVKPEVGRDATILADYIHNNSNTLENFYNSIIKIYTYECYFYSRLNQFLRNEDWTGLKTLLPYLYCFTLAFRFHNFRPDISNSIWTQAIGHKTLCLYRGAPLDKDVISFYDPKVNEYFSWSQVTSTSRRAEVAKGFFKKPANNKCNVFFEIRMFFPSNYDGVHVNKEIIDTQGRTFLPHENEYLLPPETVFHLISQEKKGDIYYIVLHVINNLFELEIQGYQLKSKVNPDPDTFHLFGLQGEKISEKIQSLEHNNVFKKIEISASRLSPTIAEELLLKTSTTEISELIFRNTFLSDQVFTVFRECLFLTKIQRLELYTTGMGLNREKLMLLKDLQYIHTLKLTGHAGQDPNNLDSETLSGLASLLPHTKLRFLWLLHFSMQLEIYEDILTSLPETLSVLATAPSVIYGRSFFQSFFLKPEPKWKAEKVFFIIGGEPISKADQIFDRIFKAAKFESLQLNFSYCERADVDDELSTLSKISVLNQPISKLEFSFKKCQLSDQGLKYFSKFLDRLPLISELHLSFEKCPKITSVGIDYLKNSIKLMKSLQSIEMSFKSCKISTAITEALEVEFKDSFEIQITNDYNELTDLLIALEDFTEMLKGKMPDENVYSAKQIYNPK